MANQQLSTNTFGTAKWIVSATASDGTHTTIAGALTAASSGDTIFIRPGTYTENLTLKAGVNLAAYECDGFTPNVTISGKCSYSGSGSVGLSGIRLQTNSDFCLSVTGSSSSTVYLNNCFIYALNNTAINVTSSGASVFATECLGDIGTTGIAMWTQSAGILNFRNCDFFNNGASTTASTTSGGTVGAFASALPFPVTTSSTGGINLVYSYHNLGAINATSLTGNGTGGSSANECQFISGTASAVSVGTGATLQLYGGEVSSSNTNAITGAGTLNYGGVIFSGSSSTINTTTTNPVAYSVPQGGTGRSTSTAYAVICGGTTTTAAQQSVASVGTSGQVLTSNGAGALPTFQTISATGAFDQVVIQTFTGNGTYTPTSGMKYCIIECVGGGGGGGGINASNTTFYNGSGGGGGGGYARKVSTSATIGSSQTVTVGAAGTAGSAGNNAGGNGGDSSVGTICIGKGGTGGSGSAGGNGVVSGGAGGVAGTGDFTFAGNQGASSIVLNSNNGIYCCAAGGNSYFGAGAAQKPAPSGSNTTGNAGQLYGGGGGGAVSFNNGGSQAGAAGAAGVVIITEYVSA